MLKTATESQVSLEPIPPVRGEAGTENQRGMSPLLGTLEWTSYGKQKVSTCREGGDKAYFCLKGPVSLPAKTAAQ